MKIAFSNLACPQWTIQETIENALHMGYNGIELRLLGGRVIDPVADYQEVVQAVRLCRANGLDVCAFDTSCQFNLRDARAQQVTELRTWIRLAQEMQVPILRVFGGPDAPDAQVSEANVWVADALGQVASAAEQASVTVVLETHDAFASARRVADVLRLVASRNIAALWDSHHPYRVGESVEDVVAALGERIRHVHIKDARRVDPQGSEWQLVLMGEGEVPVREQLTMLKRRGYSGYVSVEWEKKWHPQLPDPEIALPQHRAWLEDHHLL